MKNIYISDLDGTLINENAVLSEFSLKNLQKMIDDGLLFTIASARSIVSIRKILSKLRLSIPIIEMNGAFLSDFTTSKHLFTSRLDENSINEIFNICENFGINPFISGFDGNKDFLRYTHLSNYGMKWYYQDLLKRKDSRLQQVDSFFSSFKEDIVNITLIDRKEILEPILDTLNKNTICSANLKIYLYENIYSKGWYWLDIFNAKSSKALAIKRLIELEFNNVPHKIIVFGDQINDLEMFELADFSIAPSNAFKEIKESANLVIDSNNADGVVKYLLQEFYKNTEL